MRIIFITLLLSGCALPAPLVWFSYTKTGYDTLQIATDNPTTTDIVLSELSGKNCRVIRVLDKEKICQDKTPTELIKEYIKDMK